MLWLVNQDFVSWKDLIEHEYLTEKALTTRKDRYALPVCITMFRRQIDEDKEADKAEKEGRAPMQVPDAYKRKELARTAYAVLFAMSPETQIIEPDYDSVD